MKNKLWLICCCYCFLPVLKSQNATAWKFAEKIDTTYLYKTLSKLASDEFEGRGNGTLGGIVSSYYLSDYFQQIGVQPSLGKSYFQPISVFQQAYLKKTFLVGGEDWPSDYTYTNQFGQEMNIESDQFVFIGYGSETDSYSEYGKLDIKGKVILKLNGDPANKEGLSYAFKEKKRGDWHSKIIEKQPRAIISVENEFNTFYDYFGSGYGTSTNRRYISEDDKVGIPLIEINEALANRLLAPIKKTVKQIKYEIESNGVPQSALIKNPFKIGPVYEYKQADCNNVVGIIEGSDLKNEYLVVSAHYDHEGKYGNTIYNGADDNASGVSAVLEIARIFSEAKKAGKGPRRSIVFLLPVAEEMGLCGSDYYVNHPIYPLKSTVACVNLDMVGRVDEQHKNKTENYLYVVNDSRMSGNLVQQFEVANKGFDITKGDLEENYSFFTRSDQYNFAKQGIPSILLTSGTHPEYHQPTDDTALISFPALKKRTQSAFLLIWELANSELKAEDAKAEIGITTVSGHKE